MKFSDLLSGVFVAALAMPTLTAAQEVHSQRIQVEIYPPKTPEMQEAYDVLTRSRWMDEAQEFFGIFKLPQDITIFVRSFGMSNAWYVHGTLTVCYEYLDDIIKSIPPGNTPDGITPRDAAGDNLSIRSRTRWGMPCLIFSTFRYWGHPRTPPMISRPI